MTPISLKQFVPCSKNTSVVFPHINCSYWSLKEDESCVSYCNLKETGVGIKVCSSCKERKPLVNTKSNYGMPSPVQELKDLLPHIPQVAESYHNNDDSFIKKATKYSTAEASQVIQGKVSEEVYEKRKNICLECPHKSNPKPDEESIGWCKKCGCGSKNKRAALSNKLWIPNIDCPLKKFGKETGKGFNTADAIDSFKGAVQSIGSLFKKDENDKEEQKENTE